MEDTDLDDVFFPEDEEEDFLEVTDEDLRDFDDEPTRRFYRDTSILKSGC